MATLAEIRLWGTRIGAVAWPDGGRVATFQYDRDFVASGIRVAPLHLPLRLEPYEFPALNPDSFRGLPGLLADSLPDKYGNALIDAWLAGQGRRPQDFDPVERLCYISTRGMGALEFRPAAGPAPSPTRELEVAALVELASRALASREELVSSLAAGEDEQAMQDILSVGTSAGGARAKAVIAWNPRTGAIRSGQVDAEPGFEHWLLKFDGVENNKDRDRLADPQGYGAIEFAYSLMARDAGIEMADCRLLEEGGRRHFMTRRFDRTTDGDKLHMLSLAALAHYDFKQPAAHGYEQAFQVLRDLDVEPAAVEQLFRRMVFNVVARNQDDHVKNIAFLMDRAGRWSLSPAFDVTYSYRPDSPWVAHHQMTINGKNDDFGRDDFERCAKVARLKQGAARRILTEVTDVVGSWEDYAARADVDADQLRQIAGALRLGL